MEREIWLLVKITNRQNRYVPGAGNPESPRKWGKEHKNKNNDSVNRARFTMHRKLQNVVHVSVEFEFPNVVCGTC